MLLTNCLSFIGVLSFSLSAALSSGPTMPETDSGPIDSSLNVSISKDMSVHYLRNVGLNKLLDINYGRYDVDAIPHVYQPNYSMAQRFVFQKSYGNTYMIRPLAGQNVALSLPNNNAGESISLQHEHYDDYKLFWNRLAFRLCPNTTDTYYIKTLAGVGDYYLGADNTNYHGIYASNLPDSDDAKRNFMWKVEYCDTLNVFDKVNVSLQPNASKRRLFTPSRTLDYVVKKTSHDIKLTLRDNSDHHNMLVTTDNASIIRLEKNETYELIYENFVANPTQFDYMIEPRLQCYFYSVYDYYNAKYDMVSSSIECGDDLESNGLYPMVQANLTKNSLLAPDGDLEPTKSKYFIYQGHGCPGNAWAYNGISSRSEENFNFNALPDFTNCELASWYTCSGAALKEINGYVSSMARESVVQGAHGSLGFGDEISIELGCHNKRSLAKYLNSGVSNVQAIHNAHEDTKKAYFFDYIMGKDKPLWNPVYYERRNGKIQYCIANSDNPTWHDDNGGNIRLLSESTNKNELDLVYADEDSFSIKIGGILKTYHGDGYVITNIPYSETGQAPLPKNLLNNANRNDNRKDFFLRLHGKMKHFTVICSLSASNEFASITDVSSMSPISIDAFNKLLLEAFYEK